MSVGFRPPDLSDANMLTSIGKYLDVVGVRNEPQRPAFRWGFLAVTHQRSRSYLGGRAFMMAPDRELVRVYDTGSELVPWEHWLGEAEGFVIFGEPCGCCGCQARRLAQAAAERDHRAATGATARRCACGRICGSASARTCGSRDCIDRLGRQR